MNSWSRSREVEKPKQQCSVASLPEHEQDAAMERVDRAREGFPTRELDGASLHVCMMGEEWQVWLNCEQSEFTGLCVSIGLTRQAAVTDAVRILEAAVDALQEPA